MNRASGLRFKEIAASAEDLAELTRFYRRAYVREFPDADERESLANMKRYLRLKAQGWYGRNSYHIVVAQLDGEAVGGSVFDYLAEPNAGVIEFLFVDAARRMGGLGKALLDETARVLESDARAAGAPRLAAIVAEMNDPFRPSATPDNFDPFVRCAVWGKWGFHKIEFPYVQPALSPGQKPVEGLALIARPAELSGSSDCDPGWALSVVGEYMRWAMRIEEPSRNPQYRGMADFLGQRSRVPLTPLRSYVGRDPHKALHTQEIDGAHASFQPVLKLLRDAIKAPGRVASERQFQQALSGGGRGVRYHLWGLHGAASDRPEGMASFFAMRPAGFGGYIVLGESLRGRGLLRALVARIEEQMIRDAVRAKGWFIECGEEALAAFLRTGFHDLRLDYRPPAVGSRRGGAEPLHLLYKPFGSVYEPPRLARKFVLDAVAAILKRVYGIAAPRAHPCYVRASASFRQN